MDPLDEIRSLRKQVDSDLEVTWTLMHEQGERTDARFDRVDRGFQKIERELRELRGEFRGMRGELAETRDQVMGRLRLLDQRFGHMLGAVEKSLDAGVSRAEFSDLEQRVARLEGPSPPAA